MPFLPQQAPAGLDVEGLRKYVEEQFREVARAWTSVDAAFAASTLALAAVTSAAGSVGGPCKLVPTVSSPTLTLRPFGGGALKINGVFRTVPAAGVVYTASGLTGGVIYYVYAFMSGSTMALELSTTGHSTSVTAGNIGTEIKTGDDTRSLVGMVYANAANGNWDDNNTRRLVRSWFNDSGIAGANVAGAVINTTSTTVVGDIAAYGLVWAGEQYHAQVGGQCFQNTVAALVNVYVMIGGSVVSVNGIHQCAVANFQSWAQVSHSNTVPAEGLTAFVWGWSVSGGTGSVASRVIAYMTVRR